MHHVGQPRDDAWRHCRGRHIAEATGGCSEPANDGAPRATAAGTSPINPDIQAAFCQDQVAFMHGAEPQFATAHAPVVAEDGSTTIEVTIAKDNEGIRTFQCRLDASNRFAGVTTTSIQGAL